MADSIGAFVKTAPPRFIGACLLLAMTMGFVVAEHVLPQGETLLRMVAR